MKDGGPAFPRLHTWEANSHGAAANTGYEVTSAATGMTLRDYFAGQTLPALANAIAGECQPAEIAAMAYALADAMIAARDAK